jgi:predicted nucleic acid-binding protein
LTPVVDASLVLRLLANRAEDDLLRQRLSALRRVHAPHLLDVEVASGVRGLLLGNKLALTRAYEMLDDFAALPIRRYPMTPLHRRIIQLRGNLMPYDATYVVLAETLRMPLLTTDAKLAGSTGHAADVHIYPSQALWADR